jgi:alpha-beta hydrolase superfamily lysophospholipase
MKHTEGYFEGVRSTKTYYQAWLPDEEPKAVLLVVHGMGEHSGRYRNVANHFAPRGYAVYAFDLPGHGKTEGPRTYIEHFCDFSDNLQTFYQMVTGWQPGKPIFLLGHSMGGGIAAYYLLDHQDDFAGAILSAPTIKVGDKVTNGTIFMAKVLSKLAPKAGVMAVDPEGVSKDPAVVQAYIHDPLVHHGKVTARLGAELLTGMMRITAEVGKISLPFIVVQGGDDVLVDPVGAKMLYEQASSADKTIRFYEGLHHEVFNEPEREIALQDVGNWLEAHL